MKTGLSTGQSSGAHHKNEIKSDKNEANLDALRAVTKVRLKPVEKLLKHKTRN